MLLLFMLLLTHSETAPSYRRDINTERRHTLRVRVRDYQLTCDDRATTNLSLPQKSPLPGSGHIDLGEYEVRERARLGTLALVGEADADD